MFLFLFGLEKKLYLMRWVVIFFVGGLVLVVNVVILIVVVFFFWNGIEVFGIKYGYLSLMYYIFE